MPPLRIQPRGLRPTSCLTFAGLASQKPRIRILQAPIWQCRQAQGLPPTTFQRRANSSNHSRPTPPDNEKVKSSTVDSVSSALHNADPSQNNLLSPVHIPEDPNGVLSEKHPAASILANSSIVITRQLELMNVMLGFEQANKYVIMDPQGQHIGFMAEMDLGMGNMVKRQMLSTHRSFTTHIFDRFGKEVLRFHRPFSWISSRIGIYDPLQPEDYGPSSSTAVSAIDPGGLMTDINQDAARVSSLSLSDMQIIGEAQQQWAPLRRKYNLFVHCNTPVPSTPQLTSGELPLSNSKALQPSSPKAPQSAGEFGQFAYVNEPFLSWDFSLMTSDSKLLGSVNRNFSGFGREIFTDTGVYALRMDSAGLAQEPGHLISKSAQKADPAGVGMTLDQRAVTLATAVSIDFDYFSRKSGGSGMMGGFLPVWFPGGGGAAGAEAGAEAGAVGGAQGGAGGASEDGDRGREGPVATPEDLGAYDYGDDASPTAGQDQMPDHGAGQSPTPPEQQPGQVGEGEDVWGGGSEDPWGQGDQGGQDGGAEGGWFDSLSDLLNND